MTRPRTLLVVDDDRDILEVLDMRLSAMGFAVTATPDPEAALEVLGQRGFDLALFDLRMEPLDGIALTRAAHARQSRLPVLIMTAHGTIENAIEAIKEGAHDFITKPFVPEELRGKIGRALAERRWARDRDLLRQVGESLASSAEMERVLQIVAQGTLESTETERAMVVLREDDRLVVMATAGASPTPETRLLLAAESAMGTREHVADASEDGRVVLAAPLMVEREAAGALVIENPGYVVATDEDLDLLRIFAAQAAIALKNARELSRLRSGALAALGRVATQVAHELNNPIGGLTLYADNLEQRFQRTGDTDGVETARKVRRAVERLAELVTDITAYGRQPELRRERVPGNAVIEDCLALMQDRLAEKQIRVERALDATVGPVLIDVREMRKVFGNLLVNALEAMEPGGTLTVRSRRTAARSVEFEVADTGCGMDAETRSRMFDLFFTTKPNGTGLGMAIAGSVVDRHGGRLQVESAPDRGTQVRISLPAA